MTLASVEALTPTMQRWAAWLPANLSNSSNRAFIEIRRRGAQLTHNRSRSFLLFLQAYLEGRGIQGKEVNVAPNAAQIASWSLIAPVWGFL